MAIQDRIIAHETNRMTIQVFDSFEDPDWDSYVEATPGGHHVQTTLWSQVKRTIGWKTLRVITRDGDQITGGAQMLIRPFPLMGAVGYIPRGPLCSTQDPAQVNAILDEIIIQSKKRHIRLLAVQPPENGSFITSILENKGFRQSTLELAPIASIVVDLTQSLNEILVQMKRQTRQNVRNCARKGVITRVGSFEDLSIFYDLHCTTAKRQQFIPYPKRYFEQVWTLFHPRGQCQLIMTEIDGQPTSSMLLVAYRDTVLTKIIGWNGNHKELKPNDALFWGAIRWGKEHGYHFIDFEGIDMETALNLLNKDKRTSAEDEPATNSIRKSMKVGFGGKVVLYPPAYDIVFSPLLRSIYQNLRLRVATRSIFSQLLDLFRKR